MADRRDRTGPQPIAGILRDVLDSCGLNDRIQERELLVDWAGIVGPEIAAHSRAVDIREGVLYLDADHGMWRQELTLLLPEILKKLNAKYGEGAVTEVRWQRPIPSPRKTGND
jgi:predicted nucleic acid-binding Zn ribbon protein